MEKNLNVNVFLFYKELTSKLKLKLEIIIQNGRKCLREMKYSSSFRNDSTRNLAELLMLGHVLEKGITMPSRKQGFGYERVRKMIALLKRCLEDSTPERLEIQAGLADLKQYADVHQGYDIPEDICNEIEALMTLVKEKGTNCYEMSDTQYFATTADFRAFAQSRHSVRWFSDATVDLGVIKQAISIAQTAPSACNRQATRVKIIKDKTIISEISNNIQKGNRGFGNKAPVWLLITQEQGAYKHDETCMAFVDAGIFTMNLLYALHYYKLAACTLNAQMNDKQEKVLRQLLNLPSSEIPAVFITVGIPPKRFMVARSQRLDVDMITQICNKTQ